MVESTDAASPAIACSFLVGCPDFVIEGFRFSGSAPVVTVANRGSEASDAPTSVTMTVDGETVQTISAPAMSPFALRDVGFSYRFSGSGRRVLVEVDSTRATTEESEYQNTYSRELAAPGGADVGIVGMTTVGGLLQVKLKNFGTVATSAMTVYLLPRVDDVPRTTVTVALPALSLGQTFATTLSAVALANSQLVEVALVTNGSQQNADYSNDRWVAHLPNLPSIAAYEALLNDPRILPYTAFHGVGTYASWPAAWRVRFSQIIELLTTNRYRGAVPTMQRESDGRYTLSADEAREVYLSHLAHSLWLEVQGVTAWSLLAMPADQRQQILDGRTYLSPYGSRFFYATDSSPTDPRAVYRFFEALGYVKETPADTVRAFTDWWRGHIAHGSVTDDPMDLWGFPDRDRPPPLRILYPLASASQKFVTTGCWGTTAFMTAVFRTLNIAVFERTTLQGPGGYHSAIRVPAAGLNIVHSDELHTGTVRPSGGRSMLVPTSELFISDVEWNAQFNTDGATQHARNSRRTTEIAVRYLTEYLSTTRYYGIEGFIERLQYPPSITTGPPTTPVFSALEAAEIVSAIQEEIARLGGRSVVSQREARYEAARAAF